MSEFVDTLLRQVETGNDKQFQSAWLNLCMWLEWNGRLRMNAVHADENRAFYAEYAPDVPLDRTPTEEERVRIVEESIRIAVKRPDRASILDCLEDLAPEVALRPVLKVLIEHGEQLGPWGRHAAYVAIRDLLKHTPDGEPRPDIAGWLKEQDISAIVAADSLLGHPVSQLAEMILPNLRRFLTFPGSTG